jgi:hypothetical protein
MGVRVKLGRLGRHLWAVAATSALLLFVSAFEWSLVDALTPFFFPVLELAAWLLFLGSAV